MRLMLKVVLERLCESQQCFSQRGFFYAVLKREQTLGMVLCEPSVKMRKTYSLRTSFLRHRWHSVRLSIAMLVTDVGLISKKGLMRI